MDETERARREAEFDERLLNSIEKHGWFGLSVAPGTDDPDPGPGWTYSIGFETSLGCPNVIIVGQRSELRHAMLWHIFDAMKSGHTLSDGAEWDMILDDYVCVTRAVHPSHLVRDWFGYGMWYRDTHAPQAEPYAAFQLFWPSVNERLMPWDKDCPAEIASHQTRLDIPTPAPSPSGRGE